MGQACRVNPTCTDRATQATSARISSQDVVDLSYEYVPLRGGLSRLTGFSYAPTITPVVYCAQTCRPF